MKTCTIRDTCNDHTEVRYDGGDDEVVVRMYQDTGAPMRGRATMRFSLEQSRQLRKALKRAERELSA